MRRVCEEEVAPLINPDNGPGKTNELTELVRMALATATKAEKLYQRFADLPDSTHGDETNLDEAIEHLEYLETLESHGRLGIAMGSDS